MTDSPLAAEPFLAGGGDMARRIAGFDWNATPLGPIENWSAGLKHTVGTMLSSPVPHVMLWGEQGVMLYNDAYARFAGERDERLLGSNVREGWDEVADFNDNVMRVGLSGQTLSYTDFELTLYRNGTPEQVFMNLDYSPVRDEAGVPVGVLAVVVDTTQAWLDRKALEENARKLEFLDELGRAIATASDADAILASITRLTGQHLGLSNCAYADMDDDGDGFTILGNWHRDDVPSILGHYSLAAFGTLAVTELGNGRPLIIRDNLRELLPEEAATFQAIGVGSTICMPLIKDGKLTALMAIHHSGPHDWTEYELEVIREVTERSWAHIQRVGAEMDLRNAAAALRELNETLEQRVQERSAELLAVEEQLRQAHKMEAVGQLTGGLAHDFNNLLTGLGGALEIIEASVEGGRTRDLKPYFTAASASLRRAASLTHRLLAFSRQQTLDPKPTDINALVGDLGELLERTLGPSIDLRFELDPGLWAACIDRNQLENAVLNLCINARDAMPDGGQLTLSSRNIETTRQLGWQGGDSLPAGRYMCLTVRDTGHGMDADVRAKAFDPFFSTKPMGKGTGLGLSMVYGFVRQSGGDVEIDSAPGKGTAIHLMLPYHADRVAPVEPPAPVREVPLAGGGETVLVTDDEVFVRLMVSEGLEDAGYAVIEAEDGPSALEQAAKHPEIALLVTDVGLPNGMTGRQLADAARESIPGLKVLFITGYAENAISGPSGLEPGTAVLTKPFEIKALAEKVAGLLATAPA